jgi:hypothetical protein
VPQETVDPELNGDQRISSKTKDRLFRSEVKAGEANCATAYPHSFVQPDPVALGDLDLDASSPAWPIDHGARSLGWRVNGDISQCVLRPGFETSGYACLGGQG